MRLNTITHNSDLAQIKNQMKLKCKYWLDENNNINNCVATWFHPQSIWKS